MTPGRVTTGMLGDVIHADWRQVDLGLALLDALFRVPDQTDRGAPGNQTAGVRTIG